MPTFPQGATDITDAEAAHDAASQIAPVRELAVDVEADAMHAFRARLCFVQVGTDDRVFLFDTLAPGVKADVLASTLGDPAKTKFFHAAQGDLQYLAETGIRVQGLFDTHRAATLLGWAKVGLADLVRERLGIELLKEHQQSDFSIRPLPPGMRDYIADDVRYLVEIGRQVRDEARKADVLEEIELDCLRIAEEAAARPDVGAEWKPKLPRGSMSTERYLIGMTVATELHRRRLKWAEQANIPMGRMLSNAAITAIATKLPATLRELQRSEGVRGAFAREHGDEVLTLLTETRERATKGELTLESVGAASRPDPFIRKRSDALKSWRAARATERKVTPSVVLTNPLVDELAKSPPQSTEDLQRVAYFGEKRVRLYGAELVALLNKA